MCSGRGLAERLEPGVRGRQTESKALIAVAAEEDCKGIGRYNAESRCHFLCRAAPCKFIVHSASFRLARHNPDIGIIHELVDCMSIATLCVGTAQAVENCRLRKLEIRQAQDGLGLLAIGLGSHFRLHGGGLRATQS